MLRLIQKRAEQLHYRFYSGGAPILRFDPAELRRDGYFGQYGQDKLIAETLAPNLRGGVFVDIGAHDGESFSNTVFLERERGWTGLAIEPLPDAFAILRTKRSCHCVQGAIAAKTGTQPFLSADMLSGLLEAYSRRGRRRLKKVAAQQIEVPCYRFNDLAGDRGYNRIDYLSIDTEGAEYQILSSIDFSRFDIRIIGVENNHYDARLSKLLYKHGYKCFCRIGVDEIYIKDA